MKRHIRSVLISKALKLYHLLFYRLKGRIVFHGLTLMITRGVFIPKFTVSTDLLVEVARMLGIKGRVLDFGCGSGALSLVIASFPGVEEVVCYDKSVLNRRVSVLNAVINGLQNKVRFSSRLSGCFDVIVSNPPYLPLDPMYPLEVNWSGDPRWRR